MCHMWLRIWYTRWRIHTWWIEKIFLWLEHFILPIWSFYSFNHSLIFDFIIFNSDSILFKLNFYYFSAHSGKNANHSIPAHQATISFHQVVTKHAIDCCWWKTCWILCNVVASLKRIKMLENDQKLAKKNDFQSYSLAYSKL